jgi:hypothetical protein
VADYVNVFGVGEAIREPLSQAKVAAVLASTDSQPRVEDQDRTSQINRPLYPQRASSSRDAREFSDAFLELQRHIYTGLLFTSDLEAVKCTDGGVIVVLNQKS